MAAPTPTTRDTPLGIPLKDGYQTLVTCALDPDISIWEKMVTPPGIDFGEPVDFTTMWNTTYTTFQPAALATLTPCEFTAGYDPDVYDEILAIGGTNTTFTVTFPDGSTLAFYGFLRSFTPAQVQLGTMPEATCNIQPTNWDPANNVEASPVMTEVEGT